MEKSLFEQMGGTYTQQGDYVLASGENNHSRSIENNQFQSNKNNQSKIRKRSQPSLGM